MKKIPEDLFNDSIIQTNHRAVHRWGQNCFWCSPRWPCRSTPQVRGPSQWGTRRPSPRWRSVGKRPWSRCCSVLCGRSWGAQHSPLASVPPCAPGWHWRGTFPPHFDCNSSWCHFNDILVTCHSSLSLFYDFIQFSYNLRSILSFMTVLFFLLFF